MIRVRLQPWVPLSPELAFRDFPDRWLVAWPDFSVLEYRDQLTGIPNRRAWDEGLTVVTTAATAESQQYGVLVIDLDHFKEVNDTYGHQAGDLVLQTFAGIAQANLRLGDLLCRYGGEEFGVLLPGVDSPEAITAAERIRRAVETAAFSVGKGQTIQKTCSIGVAAWPITSRDPLAVVKSADEAVYAAKNAGRNRVVSKRG